MATPDLFSLLNSSRNLANHLEPQELPHLTLGLDQIEDQSRRLLSRTGQVDGDGRANYLLAQARVNAPQLADLVTSLNPSVTFSPLQPIHDTDVSGYLRHSHEQSLISTIEESRRETLDGFYQSLEERVGRDWEERKKKVFEELSAFAQSSQPGRDGPGAWTGYQSQGPAVGFREPSSSLAIHTRMMAFDRVVVQLNEARLQDEKISIVHSLADAIRKLPPDAKQSQTIQNLDLLASIIHEPDVRSDNFQRSPLVQRHYAPAYLSSNPSSDQARELRRRIIGGSMKWLEETFMDYVDQTLGSNPVEAALGGSPSPTNKLRAYLALRYYESGTWQANLELVKGQPLWAKIYLLLRSGHFDDALTEAQKNEAALDKSDKYFFASLKEWVSSGDRSLNKMLRDRLLASYNANIRHAAATIDPYKVALFKLLARAETNKRNLTGVTNTTEDWLWLQLAMVQEPRDGSGSSGGLKELAGVVVAYGEKYFDNDGKKPWMWNRILLACGEFERAVSALYDKQTYELEAVHMAIALAYYGLIRVPTRAKESDMQILTTQPDGNAYLNFVMIIGRYIRHFARTDPREALQYVYLVCLNSDIPGAAGKEQVDAARALCQRVVAESTNPDELLGGVKPDNSKYPGVIEQNMKLLGIKDVTEYHQSIVHTAAVHCQAEKRLIDAINLYNVAEEYDNATACLAHGLGETLSAPPGVAGEGDQLRQLAVRLLYRYENDPIVRGKVNSRSIQTCYQLLRLRQALEEIDALQYEQALEIIDSVGILPLTTRIRDMQDKVTEIKQYDDAIVRNLSRILIATMNVLLELTIKAKNAGEYSRSQRVVDLRDMASRLMTFAGMLQYRLAADTHAQMSKIEVDIRN